MDGDEVVVNGNVPPISQLPARNSRHRIFLSHSGGDKPFVRELYEFLKENLYVSFYDESELETTKQTSMVEIIQKVKEAELVLFVLSEDFFIRTWNPMLELVACVESNVTMLPLFYKLTVEDVRSESNVQLWRDNYWDKWEKDDYNLRLDATHPLKVDVSRWRNAVPKLWITTGIVRKAQETETSFRRRILDDLCTKMPPDIKWDDSHVQGRKRLLEDVHSMFESASKGSESSSTVVLGLYGVRGLGKTTLCESLLNLYHKRFKGRVHCVHLDLGKASEWPQLKGALKRLAGLNTSSLDDFEEARGRSQWREMTWKSEVFLVLDGVMDEKTRVEARKYLDSRFLSGSLVVVTARSRGILSRLKDQSLKDQSPPLVPKLWSLAPLPELTEEEAIKIFVGEATLTITAEVRHKIIRYIQPCFIRNRYHPGMLKALGAYFNSSNSDICDWKRGEDLFKNSTVKQEMVFSGLRESCNTLFRAHADNLQKFLDVALYLPRHINNMEDVYIWVGKLMQTKEEDIKDWLTTELSYMEIGDDHWKCNGGSIVHGLYAQLAAKIVMEEPQKFQNHYCEIAGDFNHPEKPKKVLRIGCRRCNLKEVDMGLLLNKCKKARVLFLHEVVGLLKMNIIPEVGHLSSIEILLESYRHPADLVGLQNFRNVVWLSLSNCKWDDDTVWGNMKELKQLRIERCGCKLLSLGECAALAKIFLVECKQLQKLRGLGSLKKLQELSVISCPSLHLSTTDCSNLGCLKSVDPPNVEAAEIRFCGEHIMHPDLSGLDNLRTLELDESCMTSEHSTPGQRQWFLQAPYFTQLTKLQSLKIKSCNRLSALRGIGCCKALATLSLENCCKLESLENLGECTALCSLNLYNCNGISTLPDMRGCMKLEEIQIVSASLRSFPLLPLQSLKRLHMRECRGIPLKEVVRHLKWDICCGDDLASLLPSLRMDENDGTADLLMASQDAKKFLMKFSHTSGVQHLLYRLCSRLKKLPGLLSSEEVTKGVVEGLGKSILEMIKGEQASKEDDDVDFLQSLPRKGDSELAVLKRLFVEGGKSSVASHAILRCIRQHKYLRIVVTAATMDESKVALKACLLPVVNSVIVVCASPPMIHHNMEVDHKKAWKEYEDACDAAYRLAEENLVMETLKSEGLEEWIKNKLPSLRKIADKCKCTTLERLPPFNLSLSEC